MLEYGFMQRALAAALVIGAVGGVLGFFVVLRRLAFIGVGISHSAIGGVALGVVLGVSPLWTGAAFAVAVALGIAAVGRRVEVGRDVAIGVFFSGAMALGVVLFGLERGARQDLFGYLFGNVLAIRPAELAVLAGVAAAVLATVAVFFHELLFVAYDEEVAHAYGHRVAWLDRLLLVLLAAAVVVGVRLVGVLLIEALLVVPAATAALWAPHWRSQIALSTAIAVASGVGGLALAYALDLAAGGTIALVAVVLFFLSLLVRGRRSA